MNEMDSLLEPIKYYKSDLKQRHADNVNAFIDEETKKSNVDPNANKAAVDDYNKKVIAFNNSSKYLKKTKTKLTCLLVFGIILIPLIIGIFMLVKRSELKKTQLVDAIRKKEKAEKEMNIAKEEARKTVSPLLARLNNNVAPMLMEKTIPFINFDDTLSPTDAYRIEKQFDSPLAMDFNQSTLSFHSGHLNNNPFILKQNFKTYMGSETYHGSLVVTYTVTYTDKDGTHTSTRTETLHAHVTKPKPFYSVETSLDYYTSAAPKLSFARKPTDLYRKSEREVNRYIARLDAEETKKAQKAIKKGLSYTKLPNIKFESYFNSSNRNNELEYRLLFTPLAQNNMVYLFSQNEPYGDDIYYVKDGMKNTVSSSHSSKFDYSGCPYLDEEYDYEVIKDKLVTYCNEFFCSLFYDFAVLLSIPLFNQHLSEKFLEKDTTRNFSVLDTECLINKADINLFKHPDSSTEVILKTKLLGKDKDKDIVNVCALSYIAIPQVDTVPVMASNGNTYLVPVHYFIYEPLENNTKISVYNIKEGIPSKSLINYRNMDFEIINN